MHLGNGTVTTACAAYGVALASVGIGMGMLLARRHATPRQSSIVLATACVFAAQAINIPVLPGVSAHLVGGFLLAYWFGAGGGAISMTTILALQAVFLGDGALANLGLNVLNMAVVPCLIVYPLWERWSREKSFASIALASFASVVLASVVCAVELQASGVMTTMLTVHAAAGLLEALLTVAIIAAVEGAMPVARVAGASVVLTALFFGGSSLPDGLEFSLDHAATAAAGR